MPAQPYGYIDRYGLCILFTTPLQRKQGTGLKECIISGILSVDGKKVLLLTHQLSTRNMRQRSPCGQNCVHGSGWFECGPRPEGVVGNKRV